MLNMIFTNTRGYHFVKLLSIVYEGFHLRILFMIVSSYNKSKAESYIGIAQLIYRNRLCTYVLKQSHLYIVTT